MESAIKKLDIFARRVSTENQNLEMQMAADKKFRDQLEEGEYIEINELGISANKVKLQDREKMLEVLSLIRQGVVNTLYVYDRSRLTRNFYEYLEIVDLLITYDVRVVFTTTDSSYSPFSSNYLVEGFNGILIEEEGKAIARRVKDTHQKLPARKYGYEINKEDDKRSYVLLDGTREIIYQMFEMAKRITNTKDFISFISSFAGQLKKQTTDIIRILNDPFYAGCEKVGTNLNPLPYVEKVISKETFSEVQSIIKPFSEKLQQNINERNDENILHPKCARCKKEMVYRKNRIGKSGIYTCSNKHRKISISVDIYNEMLLQCCGIILENLNSEAIEKKGYKMLSSLFENMGNEIEATNKRIEQIELDIATMPIEKFISQDYEKVEMKLLSEHKKKRKELREQLLICENNKFRMKFLVSKIKVRDLLKEDELLRLINLIVKECFVNETTLILSLFYNEYLDIESLEKSYAISESPKSI